MTYSTSLAFRLFVLLLIAGASTRVSAQVTIARQLIEAVEDNDKKQIKALFKLGADVNLVVRKNSPRYLFFISRDMYLKGLEKAMKTEQVEVNAVHANATVANEKILKLLLKKRANIDAGDSQGKTPLMYALRSPGGEDYALLLIRKGANYTTRDNVGNTALHYAALGGNMGGIRFALAGGQDINITNNEGLTPLHAASVTASLEVIQEMVELGADLSMRDNQGLNALHYAAGYGSLDKVKWMLSQDPGLLAVSDSGYTPLDLAQTAGNTAVASYLRSQGAFFSRYLHRELVAAIQDGDAAGVTSLATRGANVNRPNLEGDFPLHIAAEQGSAAVVRALLEAGARLEPLDAEGHTPVQRSFAAAQWDASHALIAAGAAAPPEMLYAAGLQAMESYSKQSMDLLSKLSQQTADFSLAGGPLDIPLLHYAAYLGKLEVVRILLQAEKLDPSLTDDHGWTALHWAMAKEDLKPHATEKVAIVELLLKHKIDGKVAATLPRELPHNGMPYLPKRIPAHATARDVLEYSLPRNEVLHSLLDKQEISQGIQVEDFVENGAYFLDQKDYKQANLEFSRAIKRDPQHARAYHLRGRAKIEMQLPEEAERDLSVAIELAPTNAEAIYLRGVARYNQNKLEKAKKDLAQAISMEEEMGEWHFWLGKAQLKLQERENACTSFRRADELGFPTAAPALELYCQ